MVRSGRSTNVRPSDDELLDAVLAAVAETGLAAATMDDLAQRADTTKQTLYAHFGGKDTLLEKVQDREFTELRRRLFAAYDALEPTAEMTTQMRACIEPLYQFAAERPLGIRVILDESAPHWFERSKALFGEIAARAVTDGRALDAAFPESAARVVAAMVVAGAVEGNRIALELGLPAAESIRLTANFLAGGIERAAL